MWFLAEFSLVVLVVVGVRSSHSCWLLAKGYAQILEATHTSLSHGLSIGPSNLYNLGKDPVSFKSLLDWVGHTQIIFLFINLKSADYYPNHRNDTIFTGFTFTQGEGIIQGVHTRVWESCVVILEFCQQQ